jgi:carbamoyltransferase
LGYSPAHKLTRVDLGPAYQHHEYEHALRTNGYERDAHYHEVGDETELIRQVAGRLSRGELVGWMHGGSEFGPRALGHRSILAGVTAPENDAKVNAAKHRQNWRPSAISIAVEAAPLIFSNFEADATAPFMTVAFDLTPAGAALIRAGVHHADASTRPQTVAKQDDPLFWQLLTEVGERTGLAALLNTSLNRREPLVESPEEALSAFQRMPELDSMILGRFVVTARPTAPEFVGEVSIAILKGGSGEVTTPFDRAMLDPAAQASRAVLLQTLQLEEGSADICLRVRCTASKYERRLRDLLIGDLTTRTRAAVTWR